MTSTKPPTFSLVLPTRERADTLRSTLATAVAQSGDDLEILVCDNFSHDNTRDIVAATGDPRVRYTNPGRRLSMCDNWEHAIEQCRGEYVLVIGDDDGFMPRALETLRAEIAAHPSPIYSWSWHGYTWPIDGQPPQITSIAPVTLSRTLNLRKMADFSIRWGSWRSNVLPGLYHSAVKRTLLAAIKTRTGRVFSSMAPDIFMQFALPAISPTARFIGTALTVNARSAKSNSGHWVSKVGPQTTRTFLDEYAGYVPHPALHPSIPPICNVIPDSILVAMALFPDLYGGKTFDFSAMWAFFYRAYNLGPYSDVLKMRTHIRKYHSFDTKRFLAAAAVHEALDLRTRLRRQRLNGRSVGTSGVRPADVLDCVRCLDAL